MKHEFLRENGKRGRERIKKMWEFALTETSKTQSSSLPISEWKVRIDRRTDNFRAENIPERVGRHSRRAKPKQLTLQIFRGQMDDE